MSISDHERWACAVEILRIHSDNAPRHVAERIGALALQGDIAGIATWKEIAWRIDALRMPAGSLAS